MTETSCTACQHDCAYEIVIYQIGTHDWIRMLACVPCTATLRKRHERLGPGGTQGIAHVRLREQQAADGETSPPVSSGTTR
jgi:hypothetical protein